MIVTESPDRSVAGQRPSLVAAVLRAVLAIGGFAGIVWAASVAPGFWQLASVGPAAAHILLGESFSPLALENLSGTAHAIWQEQSCYPAGVRSAAIISLRRAESAISDGDRATIDQRLAAARGLVRGALACAPVDSFLWFAAFWLENNLAGLQPSNFYLLRMSYRLGPNEGWIALRRGRSAIVLYDQLPVELRQETLHEYFRLLQSNFVTETADIFLGPGWPIRDQLMLQVAAAPIERREFFALLVRSRGYEGDIPGVPLRPFRGGPPS